VKVARKRTTGLPAHGTVLVAIAMSVTMLAGAGIIPPQMALAQVVEQAADETDGAGVLAPATHEPTADEIRTPSGLDTHEVRASGARTPTVIKKVVAKPVVKRVAKPTSKPAATTASGGWKSARVSWYGPGFYGNTMAGGGTLRPDSMVVAHRTLAFGTRIEFSYKGRTCVAVVRDRGPYSGGRVFDLGPGTAKALGFSGVGTVKYRIISR